MLNFSERTEALVDRLSRMVPENLTRELLTAYAKEIDATVPEAVETLREIATMHNDHSEDLEGILKPLTPYVPLVIGDDDVIGTRRILVHLWIKAIDETRGLVDDPASIVLTDDLMPDSSMVDDEICVAARQTVEFMCQGNLLNLDRVRTLYAAFVASFRTETADTAGRITISATTVLVYDHGRFTLERPVA